MNIMTFEARVNADHLLHLPENLPAGTLVRMLLGNGTFENRVAYAVGDGPNILTGGGDDTLDGGTSADRLEGGADSDTYIINSEEDTIVEAQNGGDSDVVQASISYVLDDNVEYLILTAGTNALNGSGNAFDNTIMGNTLNNLLVGKDSNDKLQGMLGDDTLKGRTGDDEIDGGDGYDTAIFNSNYANFAISHDSQTWIIKDSQSGSENEGTDYTQSVEHLNFADRNLYCFESAEIATPYSITDFFIGSDRIVILGSAFGLTAITPFQPLESKRFISTADASTGNDADDRFIYDTNSGNLYFDVDGSGAGQAVKIATLVGQPDLVAADITIIG